jgi:pyruvate carboxylase
VPNVCLQMLLRGRNLLGYEPYPESVVRAFVAEAVAAGIDIFRIFDALNNVEPMRVAISAALEAGAVVEGALCYTGDLSDPAEQRYTLDYYLRLAEQLVETGVHVLAVKDMAGLLRAPATRTLVSRLRSEFDVPVHLHTHDTARGQLATYLAAIEAGVDAVDGAVAPMAGMTSQPAIASIAGATDHTPRATGLALDALLDLEPYWEAVRNAYAPFESGLRAPTGRLYRHQIPGGQLSNLEQQAQALRLGQRFEEVEQAYARADALLGGIIKVTPTSKVVGDLALFAVSAGVDWDELRERPERFDLPASVIGFLRGDLGEPAGGFPEPFRSAALPRDRPNARAAPRPRTTAGSTSPVRSAAPALGASVSRSVSRPAGGAAALRRPFGATDARLPLRAQRGRRACSRP